MENETQRNLPKDVKQFCTTEKDLATKISLIIPRPFDPTKPLELQRSLKKKWEDIGKDFAIKKIDHNKATTINHNMAAMGDPDSQHILTIVCMSDTHTTQDKLG